MTAREAPRQMELDLRAERRGGVRVGAGRKRSAARRDCVDHEPRPAHHPKHPVHVVSRVERGTGVPWLRHELAFDVVRSNVARASEKGFRILHFSVQGTHVHLIVEAGDKRALGRGVQRLLSRIALALNARVGRTGRVSGGRYFRQDLTSPSQVRRALVYVLFNVRKHTLWSGGGLASHDGEIDPCSSAAWLVGWSERSRPPDVAPYGPSIVAAPQSWMARQGWYERGGVPLRIDEDPRPIASPRLRTSRQRTARHVERQ